MWQAETYLSLIDETFPGHLDEARKQKTPMDTLKTQEHRILSVKLFGLLVRWVQDCPAATKIARGIQNQSGFELWRLLWKEFHPEQANRGLIWRRALLSPKFPSKEVEFSAALQEWELDLAKYATEFGDEKAISDEDKRALLMVESPTALKQHLAMHASSLTAYDEVRQVVVSYLQAKRVWTPNATYAHHGRAKDPDAMDIGKIGDKENPKGKGKGKDKSGKDKKGDKPKGKGDGNQHGEKGKDNKEKEKCPICWRTAGSTPKEKERAKAKREETLSTKWQTTTRQSSLRAPPHPKRGAPPALPSQECGASPMSTCACSELGAGTSAKGTFWWTQGLLFQCAGPEPSRQPSTQSKNRNCTRWTTRF